jgi:hypothetical protein
MNTNVLEKDLDYTYARSAPDISLLTLRLEREAHPLWRGTQGKDVRRGSTSAGKGRLQGSSVK